MPDSRRPHEALSALEGLLALSEAMLDAARSGDWDTLVDQEAQRRALAATLPDDLASALPSAGQSAARRLIEACLRCDDRIQPLLAGRVDELRVLLRAAPNTQHMSP